MSNINNQIERILIDDSEEYFDLLAQEYITALSTFSKIKDSIISKHHSLLPGEKNRYNLEFDLDKNENYLWDIIFLAECIYNKCNQETKNEIDAKTKQETAYCIIPNTRNVDPASPIDKYQKTTNAGITFNQKYNLKDTRILTRRYSEVNAPFIVSEINLIIRSIVILQKFRDSIEHGAVIYQSSNQTIEISSSEKENYIQTTAGIPIEYIRDFGQGIIARDSDKKYAGTANMVISKLDIRLNNETLHYHIHPERMQTLLEYCNYDNNVLSKIPFLIRGCTDERIKFIFEKFKLQNGDFSLITKLPSELYFCSQERLEFFLELFQNNKEYFLELPPRFLFSPCSNERMKKILNATKDSIGKYHPQMALSFPVEVFNCPDSILNNYLSHAVSGSSLSERVRNLLQSRLRHCSLDRVEELIDIFGIEKIEEVPTFILDETQSLDRIKKIYSLVNKDINIFNSIPYGLFSCSDERFNIITNIIIENNTSFLILKELPKEAYFCDEQRLTQLINLCGNILNLRSIPNEAFKCSQERLDFIFSHLTQEERKKLKDLNPCLFTASQELIEYYLSILNNDIHLVSNLGFYFFEEPKINREQFLTSEKRIISPEQENNISNRRKQGINFLLQKVKREDGGYDTYKLKNIPRNIIFCSQERLELILSEINNDVSTLKDLPKEIYTMKQGDLTDEEFKKAIKKMINLYHRNVLRSLFGIGNEKIVALIVYMKIALSSYNFQQLNSIEKLTLENLQVNGIDYYFSSGNIQNQVQNLYNIIINLKLTDINSPNKLHPVEDNPNIKKYLYNINVELLHRLRNSSAHFRIRQSSAADDEIILEDYDNNGVLVSRISGKISDIYTIIKRYFDKIVSPLDYNEFTDEVKNCFKQNGLSSGFDEELYNNYNSAVREIMTSLNPGERFIRVVTANPLKFEYINNLGSIDVKEISLSKNPR